MNHPLPDPENRLKGADRKTRDVLTDISHYAKTREPILISGETGTGKEVVAQEIHDRSLRKDKPFIPVNCSELSPELASSDLFGHERGAYTLLSARREAGFLSISRYGLIRADSKRSRFLAKLDAARRWSGSARATPGGVQLTDVRGQFDARASLSHGLLP